MAVYELEPSMPLYEMTADAFRPLAEASFADLKMRERDDLQLLRTQFDVLECALVRPR